MENFLKHVVPTDNAICGVKPEHSRLKSRMETHEESVASYRSPWMGNLMADKGDPYWRNFQTGLADQIG
jgi:hypothetical protein